MFEHPSRCSLRLAALSLATLCAVAVPAAADGGLTVSGLEFRGAISFATGFTFAGTEVGGLSGITYDARREVYYALSDDRSQIDPARFYTLDIDLLDGFLDAGDITFVDVTLLTDRDGATFPPLATDPEGIFLVRSNQLCISSEGDALADPPVDPFVSRFKLSGRQKRALEVPGKFLPDAAGTTGIRLNLAFESLTSPPAREDLFTATESALQQDGPPANVDQPSLARILRFGLGDREAEAEYVYVVEPVAEVPDPPDAFRVNGLVELLALDDNGTFLALERSFSVGKGNTVILYEISTDGATDVSDEQTLFPGGSMVDLDPVSKRFLLDFEELGLVPDNLEGLAFGPPLSDGRLPLIVVSDNNFSPGQETQFILLALELEERDGKLVGGLDKTSKIVTLTLIGGALAVLGTADTDTIEEIGDILQFALPVAAYGATYLEGDGRGRRDFLKSAGTSSLAVILLKEALDKARPNAQGLNSFPSGHTASAFAGASFINLRFGPRWGAPALVLAGYTGASRIYADKHFLDDVISGMSISLLANRYFVFPIEDLNVIPLASDQGAGLAVRWRGSLRRWKAGSSNAAEPLPQRGFRYEWEFGGTGVDVNDFATSGSGATISYLFDEANNPTVTARVEFGYTLPRTERQELVVQVAPFEVRDFGSFASDTPFAGTLVPGGEPLRTQYLLYDYRLRYRYLVLSTARLGIHAGAGLAFQDIVATLTWPGGEADIEEGNWVPFAHLEGEARLTANQKLRLFVEVDAGRSGEDRSFDAALVLRYQFHPRWDLGIGTRRIERTVVTDRLRNRLERDQVVVAIAYSF